MIKFVKRLMVCLVIFLGLVGIVTASNLNPIPLESHKLTDNYGYTWNLNVVPSSVPGFKFVNGAVTIPTCYGGPRAIYVLGSVGNGYYNLFAYEPLTIPIGSPKISRQPTDEVCISPFEYIGAGRQGIWYNSSINGKIYNGTWYFVYGASPTIIPAENTLVSSQRENLVLPLGSHTLTDNYGNVWYLDVEPTSVPGFQYISGSVSVPSCIYSQTVLGSVGNGYYTLFVDLYPEVWTDRNNPTPTNGCWDSFEYIGAGTNGIWFNDINQSGSWHFVSGYKAN